jgi:hypothetical protein
VVADTMLSVVHKKGIKQQQQINVPLQQQINNKTTTTNQCTVTTTDHQ